MRVSDAVATFRGRVRTGRRISRRLVVGAEGLGVDATARWALDRARRGAAPHENSSLTWVEAADDRTTLVWVANYWSDTYGIDTPLFEATLLDPTGRTVAAWSFTLPVDGTEVIDVRERCATLDVALPFTGQLLLVLTDEKVVPGRPVQVFGEYLRDDGESSGVHGQYGLVRIPAAHILCAMRAESSPAARTAVVVTNGYDGPGGPRPLRAEVLLHSAEGSRRTATIGPLEPLGSRVVYLDDLFPDADELLHGSPGHVRVQVPCPAARAATFVDYADGRRVVNHGTIDRVFDQLAGLPADWTASHPVASCLVLADDRRDTWLTLPNVWGPDRGDYHVVVDLWQGDGTFVTSVRRWVGADAVGVVELRPALVAAGAELPFVGHAEVRVDDVAGASRRPSTFDLLVGIVDDGALVGEVQVGSDYFNGPKPPGVVWPGGRSSRIFTRVRRDGAADTRIFLGYPQSSDEHLDPARPHLTVFDATGTRRAEADLEIAPHGCAFGTVDELVPGAAEVLGERGQGLLRVRDTASRLYGYHLVESPGARTFPIDHLVGG